MRVLSKLLLTCLVSSNVAFGAVEELTGDKKLACEAILCLSSSEKPKECDPSISRFYSIKDKKPHKMVKKRKNFLKLCPTDETAKVDSNYGSLIDTLANVRGGCDAETLNKRTQKSYKYSYSSNSERAVRIPYIRIDPNMPDYCKALQRHNYTNIKLKYTCNSSFYLFTDFNRGYKLDEISDVVYGSLKTNEREKQEFLNPAYKSCQNSERAKNCHLIPKTITHYYKKNFINKKCWVEK